MMCYSTSCMSFQCWSREITLLSALERPWLGSCSARISLCHDDLKTTVENLIFLSNLLISLYLSVLSFRYPFWFYPFWFCPFCSVHSALSVLLCPFYSRIQTSNAFFHVMTKEKLSLQMRWVRGQGQGKAKGKGR